MKKVIVSALTMIACFTLSPTVSATIMDNNTNLSAEWTRMSARVASTNSMDAIIYNPAGTTKFEDGVYGMISNQFLPCDYSHEYNGTERNTTTLTYLVPGFFVLKKKNSVCVWI